MKAENKPTKQNGVKGTAPVYQLNDLVFRLILIPFFGIAIPLFTHMIDAAAFSHWKFKLAYAYTILLAFIIWQGNRYLLFSLRSYFDWFNKPVRKIIALLIAVSFFTIPVSSMMLIGWYYLFNNGVVNREVVQVSTLVIMICVLFITHVYETVFLVKDSETEMLKNVQLERSKAEAELQALKNQIDPHFMFNSLNTLAYLIEEAPLKAKIFNEHLADVYRYILQSKSRKLVIVNEEIDFLYDYFSLLKIRYEEAVQLNVDIPLAIRGQHLVPPISLQVLAENAFKHTEFSILHPLQLNVFYRDGYMVVQNKLLKKENVKEKESSKTGLINLAERYLLTTGKAIEITETTTGFSVALPVLKID